MESREPRSGLSVFGKKRPLAGVFGEGELTEATGGCACNMKKKLGMWGCGVQKNKYCGLPRVCS